jgi:hypothetical protein
MKEAMEKNWQILILIFLSLMVIGFSVPCSLANEESKPKWGLSILYGWDVKFFHKQPDFKTLALLPRVDLALHKNWDLELEGNFSYYGISEEKDLYLLGGNANLLFKPIRWNRGFLFVIGGGGLGYTNSNGKVKQLGDSHVGGLLQVGTGIYHYIGRGLWLRGEYRYIHISDPFRSDSGLNSHSLLVGLSF